MLIAVKKLKELYKKSPTVAGQTASLFTWPKEITETFRVKPVFPCGN